MNEKGWDEIQEFVLKHDYCSGCGVCAGICPADVLDMRFNERGQYQPVRTGKCMDCGLCSAACPFVDGNANEDALGNTLYGGVPNIEHAVETGYFLDAFVGHVADPTHRWQGASGGMASWFLKALLLESAVDHVICVVPNPDPEKLFTFEIISDPDDILRSAKSAYYPVELSQVLRTVSMNNGRYAIVGLPCFITAVRKAAIRSAALRKRIHVCIGLTCGQLMTKGFSESVTRRMGLDPRGIRHFCFRQKVTDRPASNFSMTASDEESTANIDWRDFCELAWMSGMFKLRSCDYCDDTFAELADICFMDAWLPEYSGDSSGTSLVLVRSPLAERIIREHGIETGKCELQQICIEDVIKSQSGVLRKKRELLRCRLWVESKAGIPVPIKRVIMKRPNIFDRLVIWITEKIRMQSFAALEKQRRSSAPGLKIFMATMKRKVLIQKCARSIRLQNCGRALAYCLHKTKKAMMPKRHS